MGWRATEGLCWGGAQVGQKTCWLSRKPGLVFSGAGLQQTEYEFMWLGPVRLTEHVGLLKSKSGCSPHIFFLRWSGAVGISGRGPGNGTHWPVKD